MQSTEMPTASLTSVFILCCLLEPDWMKKQMNENPRSPDLSQYIGPETFQISKMSKIFTQLG